jgi:hypothetical protein
MKDSTTTWLNGFAQVIRGRTQSGNLDMFFVCFCYGRVGLCWTLNAPHNFVWFGSRSFKF